MLSLFDPLPPVYTPPPSGPRLSVDVVGRLLAFWDTPSDAGREPPASAKHPAERPEAVSGPACHSAISRRPNRGRAVATASIARGGRLLKLKMSQLKPVQQVDVGGGAWHDAEDAVQTASLHTWDDAEKVGDYAKRGTVSSFSWRSRNRLLDLINSIDQSAAPSTRWRFVTLTYHNQEVTPRQSKAHLQSFLKRMDRHFGGRVGCLWKVEPQKRGMPHYHLLPLLPADHKADVEAEREWFARAWVEITSGTEQQYRVHRYAGCATDKRAAWQQFESWEHVAGYCGKYVGKVCNVPNESAWASAGRWWGKVNADLLPIKIESHTFTERESYLVQRLMRKAAKAKARLKGFVLHTPTDKFPLHGSTWTTRKALRASGLKLTHTRPWINAGLGGRLYILESESMRLLAFGLGTRIGWGKGDAPNNVILGYNQPPEIIPF